MINPGLGSRNSIFFNNDELSQKSLSIGDFDGKGESQGKSSGRKGEKKMTSDLCVLMYAYVREHPKASVCVCAYTFIFACEYEYIYMCVCEIQEIKTLYPN